MWLIRTALRRPIATLVVAIGVALCSVLAIARMRVDIFPNLNFPVIYVAQPYGGMSPAQMEGYLVYYYEYHFLYINGIESVEAKSIQGAALLRLTFHPGANMSEALAETISYVNRARAFMPPGTVSPFVVRYDAGTLPVGYLVLPVPARRWARSRTPRSTRFAPSSPPCPASPRRRRSGATSARSWSTSIRTSCAATASRPTTCCRPWSAATASSPPARPTSSRCRPWSRRIPR